MNEKFLDFIHDFSDVPLAIAVSGGVDSSVAVYILKQQGFEVLALHMKSPNSETAEADERRAREI